MKPQDRIKVRTQDSWILMNRYDYVEAKHRHLKYMGIHVSQQQVKEAVARVCRVGMGLVTGAPEPIDAYIGMDIGFD